MLIKCQFPASGTQRQKLRSFQRRETYMNDNRRAFLKKSFLAGAAVASLRAAQGQTATATTGACCRSPVALTAALTPGGTLIQVAASQAQAAKSAADSTVRAGVPGRKWVMVVDLAKCDGCKKCTEACGKMHFTPPDREWIKVFQMREHLVGCFFSIASL